MERRGKFLGGAFLLLQRPRTWQNQLVLFVSSALSFPFLFPFFFGSRKQLGIISIFGPKKKRCTILAWCDWYMFFLIYRKIVCKQYWYGKNTFEKCCLDKVIVSPFYSSLNASFDKFKPKILLSDKLPFNLDNEIIASCCWISNPDGWMDYYSIWLAQK